MSPESESLLKVADTSITASPTQQDTTTYVKLKDDDFIEAAGLQRSGKSGKKSSVEKLLEESLNTSESNENTVEEPSPPSPKHINGNHSNGAVDEDHVIGVKTTPERPQNLKSDEFIQDAGLSRTGNVPRKSSMERLLEDQLQTGETSPTTPTTPRSPHRYPMQRAQTIAVTSPTEEEKRRRLSSTSSTSSTDDLGKPRSRSTRKSSIYELKQIEAPTAIVGNRIASRTQHLFQQYEKDMSSHEAKPLPDINSNEETRTRRRSYERTASTDDKTKVELAREAKARELEEIRRAYQERLILEEQEQEKERMERRQNQELKCSRELGDVKGRYLSVAEGDEKQPRVDSDGEEEIQLVDKNGDVIQKSGQKERVVSSSDGVKNIKARFGGQSTWQKSNNAGSDTPAVDSNAVNSARNMFKNFDQQKDDQKSFNRPTSRKVRDPKELMEMRKKATYGDDDDIQDGVVKKSVVIDQEELASVDRKGALNKYKELESSNSNSDNQPKNRPKNRLLSDNDAQAQLGKRSDSLSSSVASSEQGDITVDVGYEGSVSPCSPTSEMSDDYISDTPKEEKVINDSAFEEAADQIE
uniref:Putative cnidarian restricted protein n=1 Tax=Clytia hemisphaerica TaxID=252671 RepID=A0A069DLU5_9CNID